MKYFLYACIAFFSLASFGAHAEGGCPPGQYPQQGQGWQTCVPIPGYTETASQVTPPPQWQSRWQAISTDVDKAVLGKSVNLLTVKDAERAAMDDCRAQGGTHCKIAISFGNGCVALAAGDVLVTTGSGASLEQAKSKATDKCNAGAKQCQVYYSACSPPVQMQ